MTLDINPYVCRTLIRLDRAIYFVRGIRTEWSTGMLVRRYPSGSLVEARTHFPAWLHVAAARLQNRFPWTRHALSI